MKLYGYFRSSAAYRARIALNLKGIEYSNSFIHLRNFDQQSESFRTLNPQGLIPVLEHNGTIVSQSIAIMEYLDEQFPSPPLLAGGADHRAYIRSIALAVACDIHPLNNLRILRYLKNELNLDDDKRNQWYRHWIEIEFRALESKLESSSLRGQFCYGDTPTMADICLVPQVTNARRFSCELSDYPLLVEIDQNCRKLDAFERADPESQPDAE